MTDTPEPAKPSAREQLREAHKHMSQAAIAEHALELANLCERLIEVVQKQQNTTKENINAIRSGERLREHLQISARHAANLANGGKLPDAINVIRELAAIPMVERYELDPEQEKIATSPINIHPETFSPPGDL